MIESRYSIPPTLNASMFSRHPLAESARAASLPLTRFESTEPQMKRSSRATPLSLIARAKPTWFLASTEEKKLR